MTALLPGAGREAVDRVTDIVGRSHVPAEAQDRKDMDIELRNVGKRTGWFNCYRGMKSLFQAVSTSVNKSSFSDLFSYLSGYES